MGFSWWQATSCHLIPSPWKLFNTAIQDSLSPPCWICYLLSGCLRGGWNPPVNDQSWKALELVGASLAWLADQNHPLMFLGKKSGRSQPSKSQRRPEVQKYGTFPLMKPLIQSHLAFLTLGSLSCQENQ